MERTLAIIKPDAVERNLIGKIIERIESNGFKIVALKRAHLTKGQAEAFYHVHKARPFFNDLTTYMSSGPVILMVLDREKAIAAWRELMGATNPLEATEGTIRKDFAINLEKNSAHGSDSPETAAFEIHYFFNQMEILP
ncbi:MAG: nucleoside-diphosphate kinase [Nitrospinaceae bacterium]